jgi:hypothetical protein
MSERAMHELLYGKGAHANPVACVEDLPLELSGRRVEGFPHSIWQLVSHMNFWMDYEVRRIRGDAPKYPDHSGPDCRRALPQVVSKNGSRLFPCLENCSQIGSPRGGKSGRVGA